MTRLVVTGSRDWTDYACDGREACTSGVRRSPPPRHRRGGAVSGAPNRTDRYLACSLDEECVLCTGEACVRCGAGTSMKNPFDGDPCTHDVTQRHTEVLVDGRCTLVGGSE